MLFRSGGTGGGVYRPGNGVTLPTIVREVKPQYTSDAMRAKVQGQVLLECVVKPDGSVGEVTVVRSLDATAVQTVDYATFGGSATQGTDYTGASGTLNPCCGGVPSSGMSSGFNQRRELG